MTENIIVTETRNPAPNRNWDWVAYRDPEGACGYGATKEEAINNLNLNLEE